MVTTASSHLFRPLQIGTLRLENRVVMAPMTRCFSPGGIPGENVCAYYRRRAEGAVGLIVTEGTAVPHPGSFLDPNVPRFYGDEALAGWKRVVEGVHAAGGKIAPQLWHVGLVRRPAVNNLHEPADNRTIAVSPSGLIAAGEQVADPMTLRQIEEVIEAFAEAAASARAVGFDGIELHGAHGYLIDQFLWEETNRRRDAYGGSIANRTRFAADIVRACRASAGRDFPIIFRLSQFKQQDYSARLAQSPQALEAILSPLVDAGVTIFHGSQRRFWEPEFEGSTLNLAGWMKKLTGRPTISVGSVGLDGEFLASLLRGASAGIGSIDRLFDMLAREEFDLVAVGRALLVNPDWPKKIKQGNFDSLRGYDSTALASLI